MSSVEARSTASVPRFAHFLPEISDKLQYVADTYLESYNVHYAFDYLVAELYETTSEDKFVFSDGPSDGGIDFFVRDSPSYTICQCKCPDLDLLQHPELNHRVSIVRGLLRSEAEALLLRFFQGLRDGSIPRFSEEWKRQGLAKKRESM